jgi:hypothetical protein
MLTAYFDESGIHKGDHLCIVAGFVGNDAQWGAVIHDWIEALKPRPNLHMRKLRWNQHPKRIKELLARLGPIPYRYNLTPVYCGIRQRDYEELMKGKLREKFTTPYMTCAQTCMAITLGEVAGSEDVLFVFERQRVSESAMENLRSFVFKLIGVDSRVQDINFSTAKKTVCLDLADYLAFQVREWKLNPNSAKAQMGMPILQGTPHGGVYTREQVKQKTRDLLSAGLGIHDKPSDPRYKHAVKQTITQLSKNPFFRGLPKR